MTPLMWDLFFVGLHAVVVLVCLLLALAAAIYMDRKVWAAVQLRRGPNVVGPFGTFQPFADLLKFVFKEPIIPTGADKLLFLLAPLIMFVASFAAWAAIPFAPGWAVADLNLGLLYVYAVSSLGVYGVIAGGWAANSKYAFLGALRSGAQMVSYEVAIGFTLAAVALAAGSLNLTEIVEAQRTVWFALPLAPLFVIFLVCALAETNRPPFDLPEAESELVAGFMVEHGSTPFLLFMVGELAAVLLMCAFGTTLFLGGWLPPVDIAPFNWLPPFVWFFLKTLALFFLFAMVKAVAPRYRYDQLMRLGWKVFLPLTLVLLVLVAGGVLVIEAVKA